MSQEDPRTVSDVNVRPELIGLESLLSPFCQNNSSQRANMFSSNIGQAVILDGCEIPRIGTGYEQMFGDYTFDTTRRDWDSQLFDVIPKFDIGYGRQQISECPSRYVILDTPSGIDYITIDNYTQLYNGFGYKNKISNNTLFLNRESGSYIDKDLLFSNSPAHIEGAYCLGVNANAAYMTLPHVTMDALVISESMAKKCSHMALHTIKIVLEEDQLPINLYGNETEPKIFPDIGECVNGEGVLMAIRNKTAEGFADLIEPTLNHVQFASDVIIKAPSGATVVDVNIYSSQKVYKKLLDNPGIMAQPVKYQYHHHNFYKKVVDCYHRAVRSGLKITPHFNDLVTRCMCLGLSKSSEKKINLVDKRLPVKYFIIEITYGYTRQVGRGFKFAGRGGDKGVVSDIWPDENMPIDEQGIRADIIISPESVANRLNPSQLYEQFFNRLCELVSRRYRRGELGKDKQAFSFILELIHDIRPEYARQLKEVCKTNEQIKSFLDDVFEDGIYLIIPPFCKEITEDKVLYLAQKYNYVESPVKYKYVVADGTVVEDKTVYPACIGSKYMYLLCKIPAMQASALEMTYINQFGLPTKAKSKEIKMQHIYGATPLRIGEDEVNIMLMDLPSDVVARFLGIRSNCGAATEMLGEKLLTAKKPSAIGSINMSTRSIVNNSIVTKLFVHLMGCVGFDLSATSIGRK